MQNDGLLWVVMADDDLPYHALAKKAIEACNLNHILTSVYNGAQLVDLLMNRGIYRTNYEQPPDGLIIDIEMKVMNGMDAIVNLRSKLMEMNIPIFLLSRQAVKYEETLLKGLNVQGSFQKPLHLAAMKKMITGLCRSVHASRI